ncbi:inositol monophosphatase family protein [Streptococcus parauberis]|uniref:inositol monophosphatase family protein n=1 Tax=Streptococcus parauberis TaxID=1348 RepID=UPI000CCF59EE|nr:inositol monophosphatase family protein [Streptococcus parauberis]PNY19013.1 Inositol-1-monophosphatase [Streptococcus parauberis]
MINKFDFAKSLIYDAADFIKEKMSGQLDIQVKSNHDDLVTNVDQETQDFLISQIKKHYPQDNILAEENDVRHPINDGSVWVIDPIDGTVNFIVQGENFAIMLAYFEDGVGQFAFIYDVMKDQLLAGGGQFDVLFNDKKVLPYEPKGLSESLVICNSGMYLENYCGLMDLIRQSLGVRIYGGAGISIIKVLRQQVFGYFSYIQPWDYAAAYIFGERLGYVLLTIEGEKPDFQTRQKVMFVPEAELPVLKKILN